MSRMFFKGGPIRDRGYVCWCSGRILAVSHLPGKWAFGRFARGTLEHSFDAGPLGKITVPSRWYQVGDRVLLVGLARLSDTLTPSTKDKESAK